MKEKDASKWSNWRGVRNKLENIFASTERYDDWWGTSFNFNWSTFLYSPTFFHKREVIVLAVRGLHVVMVMVIDISSNSAA